MKRVLALIISILIISVMLVSCSGPKHNDAGVSDLDTNDTQSEDIKGSENIGSENIGSDNSVETDPSDDVITPTEKVKKITFGSYPQTEVKDATLKAKLTDKAGNLPTKSNAQKWTSYKYYHKYKENDVDKEERNFMWYIDVTDGTEKYRGIYFTAYRPNYVLRSTAAGNSYQDDNGYEINNVYWFKYEPISWVVLDENTKDGTTFLLADIILDSQNFDYNGISSTPTYNNDYSESYIRKWLNETFLNTAFEADEQKKIVTTSVDNSVMSTGHQVNPNACGKTSDKIFLLSYSEAVNDQYGLELSDSRIKQSSDYAKSQGLYVGADSGNSWWLRSPAPDPIVANFTVRGVTNKGDVASYINANYTYRGVVPALYVKL